MEKYEISIVDYGPDHPHHSVLSSLTGLSFDEVDIHVQTVNRKLWSGQTYVKAFQNLGFNTNPRFIKFNQNTPYPCILRCCDHRKGRWYLFYYNAGKVYDCRGYSFSITDSSEIINRNGSYFLKYYKMKVTSMLEVWM